MTTQIREQASLAEYVSAVEVLKLLADTTRLRLLDTLARGEQSVGDLAETVEAPSAAVSQHLAKLRLGGLVRTRRDGNRIFYSVVNEHVGKLVHESLLQADHLVGGALHHSVEATS